MKVLKKGSKGDEVKVLQAALHITQDGIFGTLTDAAVRAFQREHNLDVDGIVGAKTWAALGISDTRCVDASVVYAPLNVHIIKSPNRTIRYIAIHYTAGSSSAPGRAMNVKHVFEQRQASADFCVDDATMVQFNPDLRNYYCWAVGDRKDYSTGGGSLYGIATNRNTISIEICSTLKNGASVSAANHSGWSYTDAALDNALRLTRILMSKFNVPKERVVRHYDISGKLCPGIVGWNNGKLYDEAGKSLVGVRNDSAAWEDFKRKL